MTDPIHSRLNTSDVLDGALTMAVGFSLIISLFNERGLTPKHTLMKTTLPFVCLTTAVVVQGFAPISLQRARQHHASSVTSRTHLQMSSNPLEQLLNGVFKSETKQAPEPELPDVVIDPDFKVRTLSEAIARGDGVFTDNRHTPMMLTLIT